MIARTHRVGPVIRLNFEALLYGLFCLYAFLLPFEFILEFLFGIETIFKPYRVVSLLIIGAFFVRSLQRGMVVRQDIREDIFIYALLAYGILISLFRMASEPFHLGYFSNDVFQTTLYILTFFVFKSLPLNSEQLTKVLGFFVFGLILNSVYIFYNFFFLGNFFRDSGFMDNPNYLALGLIAALTYLMLQIDFSRVSWQRWFYPVIILFLLYIFTIAGSRTGLVLLGISLLLVFAFFSLRRKIALLLLGGVILLFVLPRSLDQLQQGGPNILYNRVAATLGSELEDVRFVVWRGTFNALEQEGYLGMGIGQFKAKFPVLFQYETNKLILEMINRNYFMSTHNDVLSILTDYGLPGVLVFLTFLTLAFRKLLKRLLTTSDEPALLLQTRLAFIIFCCLVIFGLAAENIQNQLFWFLLAFATKSPTENS